MKSKMTANIHWQDGKEMMREGKSDSVDQAWWTSEAMIVSKTGSTQAPKTGWARPGALGLAVTGLCATSAIG